VPAIRVANRPSALVGAHWARLKLRARSLGIFYPLPVAELPTASIILIVKLLSTL